MLVDGLDSFFDRLVRRFRRSRREEPNEFPLNPNQRRTGSRNSHSGQHGFGSFNNTKNVVIDRSTFIENLVTGTALDPALERIMAYANLDALVDSSARFPPPTCHPGTRLKIGSTLSTWFANPRRERNLIWLHGPAGTGKSAVAQTFAERCAETNRLGASFFFSRPNERNDPNTIIPTLVYQLAVCNPHYKSIVITQIVNDPGLLRKSRRMQFKTLIVEPLSELQTHEQSRIREPLLVVLDGLDECKGENAQREIVEMIGEIVRVKKDFPLVWLICSRPEPHLKYLFSRADFTVICGREELAIDAESIADVDFYLRDGLAGIKTEFPDVTATEWPPDEQTIELSEKASGHFGFAWTSLRYIGDPTCSDPMSRLDTLLSFLKGVRAGSSNPLEALDALYTAIFDDVPNDILPTTIRILGFFACFPRIFQSVQIICNFFRIPQATFYNAFRRLHSVVDVPSPKAALQKHLRFYHTSFEDFLRDPSRSGKFAITRDDVRLNRAKWNLSWLETDRKLFHTADGSTFDDSHKHGILPGLSWVSNDNSAIISTGIAIEAGRWDIYCVMDEWDDAFLSQIQKFDFRLIRSDDFDNYEWRKFLNRLWEKRSSTGIIRTEPCTEVDIRLLEYGKSMIGSLWHSRPATFPLERFCTEEHLFVGYGSKAIICWSYNRGRWSVLNSDGPPSEERIGAYQTKFENEGK